MSTASPRTAPATSGWALKTVSIATTATNSSSLASMTGTRSRYILNLYLDPDGTLWVGSDTGIFFQRRDGRFAEVQPPAPVSQFSQHMGTAFASIGPGEVATAGRAAPSCCAASNPIDGLPSLCTWRAAPSGAYSPRPAGRCGTAATPASAAWKTARPPASEPRSIFPRMSGVICSLPAMVTSGSAAPDVVELFPAEGRFELHDLPGLSTSVQYIALAADGQADHHLAGALLRRMGEWPLAHGHGAQRPAPLRPLRSSSTAKG